MAWGHGMGRHSVEEVLKIGENDCKALSIFLGKNCIKLTLILQTVERSYSRERLDSVFS